jgi:hypothetical protein
MTSASAEEEEDRARVAAVERSRVEAAEARARARAAREKREAVAAAATAAAVAATTTADAAAAAASAEAEASQNQGEARGREQQEREASTLGAHAVAAQAARVQTFGGGGGSAGARSKATATGGLNAEVPLPPERPDQSGRPASTTEAFIDFANFAAFSTETIDEEGETTDEDGDGSRDGSGGLGSQPAGPPTMNTAYERERVALLRRTAPFLPQTHIPRAGLNAHQQTLGPLAGEFCRPKFCALQCVAASCAGFLRAEALSQNDNNADQVVDITDIAALTRRLRRITIRNHPDRHLAARVGSEVAAKATLLTQQATFLESMLEDHEYVALRVRVDVRAPAGGGVDGANDLDAAGGVVMVVLTRVHLSLTFEQLRDTIVEERPELAGRAQHLACTVAFVS